MLKMPCAICLRKEKATNCLFPNVTESSFRQNLILSFYIHIFVIYVYASNIMSKILIKLIY